MSGNILLNCTLLAVIWVRKVVSALNVLNGSGLIAGESDSPGGSTSPGAESDISAIA